MSDIKSKLAMATEQLRNDVGSTMGPGGYNVSILQQLSQPMRVTKDGATVAKRSWNEDKDVDAFLKTITQVATSVEQEVGDGTTTATVMSTAMIDQLMISVNEGIHPRRIIRDMDAIFDELIKMSKEIKKEVECEEEMFKIALVSTNHDEVMANEIVSIVKAIGPYGRFRSTTGIANSDMFSTSSGYTLDSGVISSTLIANGGRPRTVTAPIVSIPNKLTADGVAAIMESMIEKKAKDVIVLCNEVSDEDKYDIISILANNLGTDLPKIYPIEYSGTPLKRDEEYNDIIGVMNGFGEVTLEDRKTTFHFDGNDERVQTYINDVESDTTSWTSGFMTQLHKERVQRLRGGYATIMASGTTKAECEERRDRIDDAILAVQSSLREGYVIGGGNHYLHLLKMINVPEYLEGAILIYLTAVIRQIHNNADCSTKNILAVINHFNVRDNIIRECVDFSDTITEIDINDYQVIDSAGIPVRVFEATRSLIHTLLPIGAHIKYSPTKLSL